MLERILEEEEDHDVGDVIVDGWTQRLVTIISQYGLKICTIKMWLLGMRG